MAVRKIPPPPPPPPPQAVPPPPPPRPGCVWIAGNHEWRDGQYVWVEGHWEREHQGDTWNYGHWDHDGDHHSWHPSGGSHGDQATTATTMAMVTTGITTATATTTTTATRGTGATRGYQGPPPGRGLTIAGRVNISLQSLVEQIAATKDPEARGLLRRFLEHPTVQTEFGAGVKELVEKYLST